MDARLLDTDLLSEVIKQRDAAVNFRAAEYLAAHGQFAFSAFTRFEIERGYKQKRATKQLVRFAAFCHHSLVLAILIRCCSGRATCGPWLARTGILTAMLT